MARLTNKRYDVVVVGAGIVGLATAWTARQRGLSVAVMERQPRSIGASVRNFGFITVTGQRRGQHWQRARKTLDIWKQIAPEAGIPVVQKGLYVLAQRPEAVPLIEAFLQTEMGEGCRLLNARELARDCPAFQPSHGALFSPHECRVESRDAIPRLAQWLEGSLGVDFYWNTPVIGVTLPLVFTSRGELDAQHCIVCAGHDFNTLYPGCFDRACLRVSTLQMMRVDVGGELRLPGAVMSDLSLVRYEGYADLPECQPLRERLKAEQQAYLDDGIHLIAVQSADGSLVVGDSHVYDVTEVPFARSEVDARILAELRRILCLPHLEVTERWMGAYASGNDVVFKARPASRVVLGTVTGGTGASTSFAFAQELLDEALAS